MFLPCLTADILLLSDDFKKEVSEKVSSTAQNITVALRAIVV